MRLKARTVFFIAEGSTGLIASKLTFSRFDCLGGLAAFGPTMFLGFWGYIRFFWGCGWWFRPYGESPFPDAEKVTEKALLLRSARSLRLGVSSLRDRSGGSAYGLLRCTSSRCVWLRQTVAALPPPDQSLHSAFRRRSWIKIKSFVELALILCRSCRRLRSFDLVFAFCRSSACSRCRCGSRPFSVRLHEV